ncbi:MAG: response regulator [Candidatus Levyibacteriota bacterium]
MNKKILVIDDDIDILDAMRFTLESAGYETVTSEKGEYAENLDPSDYPDLIILDMLLSGNDGRTICKKLKDKRETRHIPVMIVSAHPYAIDSIKEIRADDFLAKPFEVSVLLEKIEFLLS